MDINVFFNYTVVLTLYALVTAFTPGPNNIVALYAVSQNGWRRGKDILMGIAAGFLCVMVLCALFCYELARYMPSVTGVLKYIGAAYIAYLAVHVALSKPDESENRRMSFWKGFLLEFVNVKIILYAITIYTGYVLPYEASLTALFFHAVVLTVIGLSGCITWASAGGLLQKFLKKYNRPFNIAMALILLYCAAALAFNLQK
ncbi:MAG: LysE family transporter [Oscillospiraceae bacterium]|jgi:cysteine/O-acetylserine efflux protein|nr:LysE family transporter [Oscillospiraceae bacterium]